MFGRAEEKEVKRCKNEEDSKREKNQREISLEQLKRKEMGK